VIEEIYIRDLGVIEEARLEFGPGLTVLTGETGAGKTMVLTALGLLLGERSDSSSVRRGEQQAIVEGRWLLGDPGGVTERLAAAGIDLDSDELILNRSVSSEGRGRASASGRAAPVSLLSELGEQLVVVHGQSDQIRLKSAVAQREALDQYAGPDLASLAELYTVHYRKWRSLESELIGLEQNLAVRETEVKQLTEMLADLEQAALQPGEETMLAETANRLTFSQELRLAAAEAHSAISADGHGDDVDAIGLLGKARKALEQVAHHDPQFLAFAEQLKNLGYQLNDLAAELSGYLADLEGDAAGNLEMVQSRRALIANLCRKYSCTFEELLELEKSGVTRLLELEAGSTSVEELTEAIAEEFGRVETLAAEISAIRSAAAESLAEQVTLELETLAMPGSSLVVQVQPSEYGPYGKDSVSILLSSYAGAEPRPLGKGASGGELSRIMLAIEVVLAKTESAPTFIFDEVDAGVGGAAAIEVGRRLSALAKRAQVIVVTHLAQVAAFADTHLKVSKTSTDSYTASDVVALQGDSRVSELARMLSGLSESESARQHAQELVELAKKS
jgi:DNA repair protein RecN (Recombination protein N)